jgi:hypothetical protein
MRSDSEIGWTVKEIKTPLPMLKISSFDIDESTILYTLMAERKKRIYRKKKAESDDESQITPDSSLRSESETSTPRNEEDVR